MKQVLNAMQESLQEQVRAGGMLASCVSYSKPDTGAVVALLENHENYCATVNIPVAHGSRRELDTENMEIDDGSIYVFPGVSEG